MNRPSYNKTFLKDQRQRLALYQRFLPALDLKRQQLQGVLAREREGLAQRTAELEHHLAGAAGWLAFLAVDPRPVPRPRLTSVEYGQENVAGVRLPVLVAATGELQPVATLAAGVWQDFVPGFLDRLARLRLEIEVSHRRIGILEEALATVTRRVNLFDKVLIPRTRQTIRRVEVVLGDQERAGVVRAKLAKAKHTAPAG